MVGLLAWLWLAAGPGPSCRSLVERIIVRMDDAEFAGRLSQRLAVRARGAAEAEDLHTLTKCVLARWPIEAALICRGLPREMPLEVLESLDLEEALFRQIGPRRASAATVGTLDQHLGELRVRSPRAWDTLVECGPVAELVADLCRSRGDGRPIVFVPGEPAGGAAATNTTRSDRTEIRVARSESLGDPSRILGTLLFEVMNSSDWRAERALRAAALQKRIGRGEYVLAVVRLEALATVRTQTLLVRLAQTGGLRQRFGLGGARRRLGAWQWSWHIDAAFVEQFAADHPLSVAGYPWAWFGRNYDDFMFRRAAAEGRGWQAAGSLTRVLAAGRSLDRSDAGWKRTLQNFRRRIPPVSLLDIFLRLPERWRVAAATSTGVVEVFQFLQDLSHSVRAA